MEAKPTASIEQSISQYYTLVSFVIVFPIFSIVTFERFLFLCFLFEEIFLNIVTTFLDTQNIK